MKNSILFVAIICCLICLTTCQKRTDIEAEKAKIIEIFNSHNQALLNSDLNAILAENPDDQIIYSVGRGEISKFTMDDTKKIMEGQFKNGRYALVKNLITPIVSISPDGNMAWIITKIEYKYSYKDSTGNAKEWHAIDAALSIVEKRNGQWVDVAIAETFDEKK